ncbi:universal stress protein [Lysobacter soli]|uniref:universal stress protein n=1 Tax=Lysobacter soli TaxID=453783 RepID=UPI003680901A
MYKDVLVPMMQADGDLRGLQRAAEYAAMLGAHLTALESVNLPIPSPGPWGFVPSAAMNEVYELLRGEARARGERFRELLAGYDIRSDVRLVESLFVNPDVTAAEHARYADLSIVASPGTGGPELPVLRAYFSALLLGSGRPVLVVPERWTHAPLRRAVIGWRPTRQAARAIHDALPLLHRAEQVDVVEVGPKGESLGDGDQPGADIAAHLARHGLNVRVVVHEQHQEAVSSALLRHCEQAHAQLLVVGGYGHSRFREWALGGTTRELLEFGSVPMFFSH